MIRYNRRPLYGLLIVALLVALVPTGAMAQTADEPPPRERVAITDEEAAERLDTLKRRATSQIERRLDALSRLRGRIDSAGNLADSHARSLLDDVSAAEVALTAGVESVASATSVAELRQLVPGIFETTLVFALLGPKTHATIASDASAAAADRFDEVEVKLQTALDELAETGIDTAEAQADLDEMAQLVSDAVATAGPVADVVIVLQPSDWPDPAQAELRQAKTTLGAARDQLSQARRLGQAVAQFIRSSNFDA